MDLAEPSAHFSEIGMFSSICASVLMGVTAAMTWKLLRIHRKLIGSVAELEAWRRSMGCDLAGSQSGRMIPPNSADLRYPPVAPDLAQALPPPARPSARESGGKDGAWIGAGMAAQNLRIGVVLFTAESLCCPLSRNIQQPILRVERSQTSLQGRIT